MCVCVCVCVYVCAPAFACLQAHSSIHMRYLLLSFWWGFYIYWEMSPFHADKCRLVNLYFCWRAHCRKLRWLKTQRVHQLYKVKGKMAIAHAQMTLRLSWMTGTTFASVWESGKWPWGMCINSSTEIEYFKMTDSCLESLIRFLARCQQFSFVTRRRRRRRRRRNDRMKGPVVTLWSYTARWLSAVLNMFIKDIIYSGHGDERKQWINK